MKHHTTGRKRGESSKARSQRRPQEVDLHGTYHDSSATKNTVAPDDEQVIHERAKRR